MSDDDERPIADPNELDFTDDERVAEIDENRYVVSTDGTPPEPTVDRERSKRSDREQSDKRPPSREADTDESMFRSADPEPAGERERQRKPDRGGRSTTDTAGDRGTPGGHGTADASGSSSSPSDGGRGRNSAGAQVTAGDVSRWLAESFENDGFSYGFDATLHAGGDTTRQRMVSNDVAATFDTLLAWFAMNAGREAPPPEALGILLVAADSPIQFPPGTLKRYVDEQGLSRDDSIGDLLDVVEARGGLRLE